MSEADDDTNSKEADDDDDVARLLTALIDNQRTISSHELRSIRQWLVSLPFNQRIVSVRPELRQVRIDSELLGPRATSLRVHLAKRMTIDGQWTEGTTTTEYIDDLRRAILDDASRLAVYPRRGGSIAICVATAIDDIVPKSRQGPKTLNYMLVVVSVDRGMIVSGYGFSAFDRITIPEDARWLN